MDGQCGRIGASTEVAVETVSQKPRGRGERRSGNPFEQSPHTIIQQAWLASAMGG
jgi:hypothetical protein